MAIITLTTDFGYKDYFVAAIKGRLLRNLPRATVVDISHGISPFNEQECAYVVKNAFHEFPDRSIHLIGVNSSLEPGGKILVAHYEKHFFICADNGILSLILDLEKIERLFSVTTSKKDLGTTFSVLHHYVPLAIHLAKNGKLEEIGRPDQSYSKLKTLQPYLDHDGKTIIGHVIYIDHIGNVVTNIHRTFFDEHIAERPFEIWARNEKLTKIQYAYQDVLGDDPAKKQQRSKGDLLAIFNAAGYLELAIYKGYSKTTGSASTLLGLKAQSQVNINFI